MSNQEGSQFDPEEKNYQDSHTIDEPKNIYHKTTPKMYNNENSQLKNENISNGHGHQYSSSIAIDPEEEATDYIPETNYGAFTGPGSSNNNYNLGPP